LGLSRVGLARIVRHLARAFGTARGHGGSRASDIVDACLPPRRISTGRRSPRGAARFAARFMGQSLTA
jgi:hypothetical protein